MDYIIFISAHTTFALILVTVSPDTVDINVGSSTVLTCHYSGVKHSSLLVLYWEHNVQGRSPDLGTIWTYDGRKKIDALHGHLGDRKFERVETDVTREHSIQLNWAALPDEGKYTCKLEYYDGGYSDGNAYTQVAIMGMETVMLLYSYN